MKPKDNSLVKKVVGLGVWVQGFRSFPWLGVSYFLKDNLGIDSSTLQVLKNSAAVPMIAKPLYGFISDSFHIGGQNRVPYIALGALLQAISWLAIAFFSRSNISVSTVSFYLWLSNLGASLTEVTNDAIVAEIGKQPATSSQSSSAGEMQSFVWNASSVGGILGNLLAGIMIDYVSSESTFIIFGMLCALHFVVTISVRESSLNLSKSSSSVGMGKQFSNIMTALQKREILCSITWFAVSYAAIPILLETMFYYQTEYLNIDSTVMGISRVFGQVATLFWSIIYKRYLNTIPPRKLISALQVTLAIFTLGDYLFVEGFFREMGMSDTFYVIVLSGLMKVLYYFKNLPFSVLIAQLCPPGCEGSVMALLACALSVSTIVSGYFGVALASFVGIKGKDFTGFSTGLLIQTACTLIPLCWSSCIPDNPETDDTETDEESLG